MYTLGEKAVQQLKEDHAKLREQVSQLQAMVETQGRQNEAVNNYVALVPVGGISARSGTTPGSATCTIYQIRSGTLSSPTSAFTRTVYNLSTTAVTASTYVPVHREAKTGQFVVSEGSGGSGTMTTVKNNGSQVGGADIVTLDFSSDFSVTESPDTECNVAISATVSAITSLPSLATVGTITTGVWNGTIITADYLSTGVQWRSSSALPYTSFKPGDSSLSINVDTGIDIALGEEVLRAWYELTTVFDDGNSPAPISIDWSAGGGPITTDTYDVSTNGSGAGEYKSTGTNYAVATLGGSTTTGFDFNVYLANTSANGLDDLTQGSVTMHVLVATHP